MLFGAALMLAGSAVLYYAVTGNDPRKLFVGGKLGAAPVGPVTGSTPNPGSPAAWHPPAGTPTEATPAVRAIVLALRVIPGWHVIGICGPGSVAGSQHPSCNAVDIGGPRSVLFAVQTAAVNFARAGLLPIHCVIGPSEQPGWEKGAIRSRESGWVASEYNGPNSHQGHVHISGWPSIGGGC